MVDKRKMFLSREALQRTRGACAPAAEEFLQKERLLPNVLGLGAGVKWKGGEPTGEEALVILVSKKVPQEHLTTGERIPPMLFGVQTDVLQIGFPEIQRVAVAYPGLRERIRPAVGGVSIGHPQVTAGTLGVPVSDRSCVPHRFYVLSNNHILAASNQARTGDPILQPAPVDGGRIPRDTLAHLSRFVPVEIEPPIDRDNHRNLVDAALAEADPLDLSPEIAQIGFLTGFLNAHEVNVGMEVRKTGRTTGYTTGRVTVVGATVDVGYGGGTIARFTDQIVTTPMSEGGDSGSVIVTFDNLAVGLLFAGTPFASIANQMEHVQRLLGIEVAPR
jgi:hypothetical protein